MLISNIYFLNFFTFSDDHPEAIHRRLKVYNDEISKVIEFYRKDKNFVEIIPESCNKSAAEIFTMISKSSLFQ